MKRKIDCACRIKISDKWRSLCQENIAVIKLNDNGIVLEPYDPERHDLEKVLYRKVDDHGRVKLPLDFYKALGFDNDGEYDLYIAPDSTAYIRRNGNYCDVCGEERNTRTVLGRELCDDCFRALKRSV